MKALKYNMKKPIKSIAIYKTHQSKYLEILKGS